MTDYIAELTKKAEEVRAKMSDYSEDDQEHRALKRQLEDIEDSIEVQSMPSGESPRAGVCISCEG